MRKRMRIGVVCEGPTDFFAIKYFLGSVLASKGVDAEFVDLQPEVDATQCKAGWGHIHTWLNSTSPVLRSKRLFSGGLFDQELDAQICDLLFIQMDCDHLDEQNFINFLQKHYGSSIVGAVSDQYSKAEAILGLWCGFDALNGVDIRRHIVAPAKESTESWCVAAFKNYNFDPDTLKGPALINTFMSTMNLSEGRQQQDSYTEIDKGKIRRERFCKKHANACVPFVVKSGSFAKAVSKTMAAISP